MTATRIGRTATLVALAGVWVVGAVLLWRTSVPDLHLNSDPHRLDLPPAWIPAARERNLPFVISVDAHSTRGFDVLRYGVVMARRGGLRRRDVLNTEGAESFAALVRPIGAADA